MAKFTVTVDFDWMNDDFCIDEEIKKQIISSVADSVKEKIFSQIEAECREAVENALQNMNDQIDDRINAMMDEFFNTPHEITDQWGDVVRRGVSVKDIMKQKCDGYMSEMVDDQGRKYDGYGRKYTRAEYMMHKILGDGMSKTIDDTIKLTVEEAKKKIREQVTERLGKEVGKLIDIETLLK